MVLVMNVCDGVVGAYGMHFLVVCITTFQKEKHDRETGYHLFPVCFASFIRRGKIWSVIVVISYSKHLYCFLF